MSTIKRFWTQAAVAEEADGFSIRLDGKPLRIPGGSLLRVRSAALAEAVAAEWQAAGEANGQLVMDEVPLTRLAGTAQDRIAPEKGPVARELARYAESDLLCYRAEHPDALVVRQAKAWQPWLDWLEGRHGARLEPVEGIGFRAQDDAALAKVGDAFAALDADALAGLGIAVPALGSAVLGLALQDGALDAVEASRLAMLDEAFQAEQWGEDAEAAGRRTAVAADVALAERFMRLARAPGGAGR